MTATLHADLVESPDDGGWYVSFYTLVWVNGEPVTKDVEDIDSPIFADARAAKNFATEHGAGQIHHRPAA